ncbi:hypothetical protein [Haloarcula sp. CBA1129]|uniref:hypothetical protein n=1 Tax=Haloarcula sp. CBA1129 TaxID=1853684 RepID=UPI001245E850|nr:hypothetical protein [Haloarcula sp. CBA1129]KAA9399676.1 hypothetical protein Har1129_16205 [Haloarcula sp. CBA1129]
MTTASRTFTEAFQRFPDDEQARQEWLAGSDSYDGDGTENDNSNTDLDLIEGDGIGGDNSLGSNEAAADDFAESIAVGEIDGHAPDSEVNAALGADGEPVAVAATAEEIQQAGGSLWETVTGTTTSTGSMPTASLGGSGGGLRTAIAVFLGIGLLGFGYIKMEGQQ